MEKLILNQVNDMICNFIIRIISFSVVQGCQMVCFQTKNPNWGKFWRALEWKMLVCIFYGHLGYFTVLWCILWPFGNVVVIWYILVDILCQEKSGNPAVVLAVFQTISTSN
jgi:hypothetical protein